MAIITKPGLVTAIEHDCAALFALPGEAPVFGSTEVRDFLFHA
jgi:hypothetical protein